MTTFDDIPSEVVEAIVCKLDIVTRCMSKCVSRAFAKCVVVDTVNTKDKLIAIFRDFIASSSSQDGIMAITLWDTRMRVRCKLTLGSKDAFYNIDNGNNTPDFFLKDIHQIRLLENHITREANAIVGATVFVKGNVCGKDAALKRRLQSVFPSQKVFLYDDVFL